MGMLIGRLILGALCAGAVLVALERLVVWRRTEPGTDDEQWRKEWFGGRMSAAPFVIAAAGAVVVTILIAHVLFGVLSNLGGLIAFLIGAGIVAVVIRKRLPPIRDAVLGAAREIKLTDDHRLGPDHGWPRRNRGASVSPPPAVERTVGDRAADDPQAAAGRGRQSRRKRRASVPTTVDAQVSQAIARPAGGRSARPSPWTAPAAAVDARQRDAQALVDVRRELIARLRARSTALAAMVPVATAPTPVVPEAAGSDLASQASAEIAAARAQHETWQAEAAAQREVWRQDGEAQRQRWREEAQALQKMWGRPGEERGA